jgi:hypothetical protein
MAQEIPLDDVALRDWQPILHEEVDRLPEKYRVPVVLCYFEGKTHEAAARQLGWPLGTVKGRLARARETLRVCLYRRGLAFTAGGLVAVLAEGASAAVPPALLALTHKAAVSFAAGGAVSATASSTQALALAKGVLQTMTVTRLVHGIILLLAVGVVLFGAALGVGVGRDGVPGTKAQTTASRGHGGTLDPATHPDDRKLPAPAALPGDDPTKAAPADFGPEVRGLRAKVTLVKGKFEVGEAMPVKYVVKNVSRGELIVWHSGFWPNHQILVQDADAMEPPLTAFGQQYRRAFSPGGERFKNVPVKVPSGGEDAAYEQYDLTKLYDLSRPGRYTVQYVYEEKQGGWEGRLSSNKAAFEVVATREKRVDAIREYQNKLQGRWLGVELAGNGFTVSKDAREFQVLVKDNRIVLDQPSGKREFQFKLRGVERIVGEKIARVVGQEVEIDLIPLGDKEKGPTWLGTCALSGDANGFELYFYRKDHQKRPPAASAKVEVGLWVIRCARRTVSTPVRVEGLSFVVAAPERIGVPPVGGLYNFDLELRVTNVSNKPLALRTFDVFRPRLYTAEGKELGMETRRKDTPSD